MIIGLLDEDFFDNLSLSDMELKTEFSASSQMEVESCKLISESPYVASEDKLPQES
jgi:hypothetical protein